MSRRTPVEFFLDQNDLVTLFEWLSEMEDLAFLWHDRGCREENLSIYEDVPPASVRMNWNQDEVYAFYQRRESLKWRAYSQLSPQGDADYLLWHINSGRFSVIDPRHRWHRKDEVTDPFGGWIGPATLDGNRPKLEGDLKFLDFCCVAGDASKLHDPSHFDLAYQSGLPAPKSLQSFWRKFKRNFREICVEVTVDHPDAEAHPQFSNGKRFLAMESAVANFDWISVCAT